MPRVLVIFAHPRLERSRANARLLAHVPSSVTLHDLYERYPDFAVDVAEEQARLLAHDVVVWHHPVYWYSAPPLVKQWIDLVLSFGWAYGPGGTALAGRSVLHAVTTGGGSAAYQTDGMHGWTLAEFLRPLQRTATLCGMRWLPPFAVHGTHRLSDEDLERAGQRYGRLLGALADGRADLDALSTHGNLLDAVDEAGR